MDKNDIEQSGDELFCDEMFLNLFVEIMFLLSNGIFQPPGFSISPQIVDSFLEPDTK